ncbi:MAG: hypothetical protein AUI08_00660 [Gemmatimonadetes bacterium 13_2_20CM_2_65_7]|nr:MAG: hypothetical protein AUI08_00660 [Gemmatimonadetes bacterium 13_2_20CM_2_65_7]OLD02939.1 MAG: hypothetical protein AUI89_02235 [Gemmatimonadetes bacterium 13_1_40CM_3_65_8]
MRYLLAISLVGAFACAHAPPPPPPVPRAAARPAVDSASRNVPHISVATAVDSGPSPVYCPPPEYPPSLRNSGVQGRVRLELVVDTLGRPEPATVRAVTSPNDSLSSAAVTAMKSCLFTPARIGGRAVRVLIQIPIDFKTGRP